jgi:hypothetical protein
MNFAPIFFDHNNSHANTTRCFRRQFLPSLHTSRGGDVRQSMRGVFGLPPWCTPSFHENASLPRRRHAGVRQCPPRVLPLITEVAWPAFLPATQIVFRPKRTETSMM